MSVLGWSCEHMFVPFATNLSGLVHYLSQSQVQYSSYVMTVSKWSGNAQSTYKTCAWSGHMDHIQRPFLSNEQDHIMLFKSVATNICLGPELVILTARSSSTTITLISCFKYMIHNHFYKGVPFLPCR